MKIGAQLYTVHGLTKTLDAFEEVLKKVADIGYTSVQVSGTCAYEPEWLKEKLKETGLTCDLTHFDYNKIIEDPKKVVEEHRVYNCKYIGLGSMPGIWENNTPEAWKAFAEKALPAAKAIKENGGYFMYHNHAKEYEEFDGLNAMNYLKDVFPEDVMGFTLDTHWIERGGADAASEIRRFKGRIPCIHFKDLVTMPDGEKRFAPVGHGEMDFEKIIQAALESDVDFAFVEQDDCYGEDPFACLKKSYDYLKSMGLE